MLFCIAVGFPLTLMRVVGRACLYVCLMSPCSMQCCLPLHVGVLRPVCLTAAHHMGGVKKA
jgi:hypothetical protein